MPRPISVTIHLDALAHNLASVRQHLKQGVEHNAPLIWAVVKANAYGHGIENAVTAFAHADGLALLDLQEAQRARDAGWHKPILLLEGCFEAADMHAVENLALTPVVHRDEQIEWIANHSFKAPIDVYLKANSGMQRLGFSLQSYTQAFNRLQSLQNAGKVAHVTHMTHFACADQPDGVASPLQAFDHIARALPGAESLCNSAATLAHTAVATRRRSLTHPNWVRPGICLYGSSPFAQGSAHDFNLRPTQTLSAQIIATQHVQKGQGIGYGHRFVAPQDMRVGIVSCGYADGYPRHAPDFTPVAVDQQMTHLVGRVSMDMLAIDLTGLDAVQVGAKVVLWGQGGPSVDTVAHHAATIGYELLCAIAPRVPRVVREST